MSEPKTIEGTHPEDSDKFLPVGTEIGHGEEAVTIVAVGYMTERCYWLKQSDGSVKIVPASELEPADGVLH